MHEKLIAEPIRLNYDDFLALPDDGQRYEILDGDLHMSPSPKAAHQRIVGSLYACLREHVTTHSLGEVFVAPFDVILTVNDIVEPDIVYVSNEQSSIITEDNIRGVPDLLIEVLSPSNIERDTRDKRNLYARCGVPYYWIVDPAERTVTELKLVERAYGVVSAPAGEAVFSPQLFPELPIRPDDLWT